MSFIRSRKSAAKPRRVEILRRKNPKEEPYLQTFSYQPENDTETVAELLGRLNDTPELKDTEGRPADPIRWECSCLQRKCGACAMVINGRPALACDVLVKDLKGTIRLEPLRKFPVVADLITDRQILRENLQQIHQYFDSEAQVSEEQLELEHDASRCLQCGLCLEVCPNFACGSDFFGMAAAVPLGRKLELMDRGELAEASAIYRKHIYAGCGKSLACRKICPAGIDIDRMLVNSNAIAVWKLIHRRAFQ